MKTWLISIVIVLLGMVPGRAQTAATVHWDFYPNTSAADMMSLYVYQIVIDSKPFALSPTCVTDCSALIMGITFTPGQVYAVSFRVACAATPTVFGNSTPTIAWTAGQGLSIPNDPMPPPANPCASGGTPPPPTMLGPCDYAPPGSSTMEQRPIGQAMQGFNPIGPSGVVNNQADRIRQLKLWGWEVSLAQFVEGNLRPDKLDRLFLIVTCRGLP